MPERAEDWFEARPVVVVGAWLAVVAGSGPGGATAPDPAQVAAFGWTLGPAQGNEYAVWLGPDWPTK